MIKFSKKQYITHIETSGNFDEISYFKTPKKDIFTVFQIDNYVPRMGGNASKYKEAHNIYTNLIKSIGEGYCLQKTDIISTQVWHKKSGENEEQDFLDKQYFDYFDGRQYKVVQTFLSIIKTKEPKRTKQEESLKDFVDKVRSVKDSLESNGIKNKILSVSETRELIGRQLTMEWSKKSFSYKQIDARSKNNEIYVKDKIIKSVSLFDLSTMNLPLNIQNYIENNNIGEDFPEGQFSWLFDLKGVDTIIYNQVIFIKNQTRYKVELATKKKRCGSMKDADNQVTYEEIEEAENYFSRNNELYVGCNMTITAVGKKENPAIFYKSINAIKGSLNKIGINITKDNTNQLELLKASFLGNASILQEYDRLTTSRTAACCFLLHEREQRTENYNYLLYFTDRYGIPIGIDPSEEILTEGIISNRNKFVLGPSGTGKSFLMNTYLKQVRSKGADVVIVDTGNSYKGLNNYYRGEYITYTDEKPISMNPFNITKEEYNIEKREFLKNLILLLWKGSESMPTNAEQKLIRMVVSQYYSSYFSGGKVLSQQEISERLSEYKQLLLEKQQEEKNDNIPEVDRIYTPEKIDKELREERENLMANDGYDIKELSFNSFYEFSVDRLPKISGRHGRRVPFDQDNYAFMLEDFYKGGEYELILNKNTDKSLFEEKFIVFEIDNIKDNPTLFPIVTLIIMDTFLQKMRHKIGIKKVLVIEEAWKAIASPIMGQYIKYLYKTIRKFQGEAIVVTQELDDILNNEVVKNSILVNSDTTILLDQRKLKDRYKETAALLGLNRSDQNMIFTINRMPKTKERNPYKEFFIKRGNIGMVLGNELPRGQYLTYTTEAKERDSLAIYFDTYKDYETALSKFDEDLAFSKLSLSQFCEEIMRIKKCYNEQIKIAS